MSSALTGPFERRQPTPWSHPDGLPAVLAEWSQRPKMARNWVLDTEIPAQPGIWVPIPATLAPQVRAALEARGLKRLYSHQAETFELARQGHDVVVATPTASGKSLAYNLPILDNLAQKPAARALYLFPTKALSRDQEEALRKLLNESQLTHGAITYDGDTPADARRSARDRGGVLITNPDMLHAGILPHHAGWARFFANLEYIVIDELHSYRGVFGSHLANVLRRLLRVARFHGAQPKFIFSSATIGNPAAHASALIGRPVQLVGSSGAPTGARRVLIYNPPVVNAELGIRESSIKAAVRMAAELVQARVSTMIFGQSRNQVEVMLKYLRDRLPELDENAICAYRGGYLPQTRRRIEQDLREGKIRCVVATNALELGIDIGALDAVICAGYPGSMAALWQRFGRGGRRQGQSLAVLVTSSAPLDQYLAQSPQLLLSSPVEEARIDADNIEILLQHLKCGAFELPFESGESFGQVPGEVVGDALGFLTQNQVLHPVPGRGGKTVYHWSSDAYPANGVSLRSPTFDNFVIIDIEQSRTIAEMDFRSTHTMLHEQAIYQHEGEQYQVEKLDYPNHKAFVRKVKPDYYTTALTRVRVSILEESENSTLELPGAFLVGVGHGEVNVVEKVVGFKKIKFHTHENVGYGEVGLPEIQKPTTAFWLTVPESLISAQEAPRPVVIDALSGILNALHGVAAVGLMMEPRDLGRALVDEPGVGATPQPQDNQRQFEPTLYLYDSVAGGVGLAPRLYEERLALLGRAERLILHCPCGEGCPSCIGVVASLGPEAAVFNRKQVALAVLSTMGVGHGKNRLPEGAPRLLSSHE